ncbi:MAG: hypothetical protein D6711_16410 [Chloroflexi bacterium]|nr:MAG: hypothetical protein D6711_16410 [Chloroflexota bacterium]
MMQRIVGQLPPWMHPEHPVLRYLLENRRSVDTARGRWTRALFIILLGGMLLLIGYINASNLFEQNPLDLPISEMLFEMLFLPTFILQVGLQLTVLLVTMNAIGEEKRRQVWDSLRTTTDGAALALRTRWVAAVFYRMRGAMIILLLVRAILIGGLLYDLTAFEGEYLKYLTGGIIPDTPLFLEVVLLAFTMTSSLLLPITSLGVDAAVGLLISTFVQQRTYVVLSQILLVAIRVAFVGGLLFGVEQFRAGVLDSPNALLWVLLFVFAVMGDWGLSFLFMGFYGQQVWVYVPYSIFLGAAMLAFVIAQAILIDLVLAWAIRRAELQE